MLYDSTSRERGRESSERRLEESGGVAVGSEGGKDENKERREDCELERF